LLSKRESCVPNVERRALATRRLSRVVEARIAGWRGSSKGLAALQVSLPPGEKTICFPLSRPRRAVIEERLPCPERPEASVGYEASIAGCPEVRIAGLRGSSKGFVALRVSLPLGKNMVYVPCSGGAPSASHPRRVVVEEGVLCPERRKASVDYEATIAGCRGQDSRAERELEGVGGTRRCATAPLATFGGPGLPLAALPDADGILAPHSLAVHAPG